MPDVRWRVSGCEVVGTMLGSREGSLFARGQTVLRREDRYLIVQRWDGTDAVGIALNAEDWAVRQQVDEATALEGPAPTKGLTLWLFGPEFGDMQAALTALRPAVQGEAAWPHPGRFAYWVDEYAAAPLRDEWANEALAEAARALPSDPRRAVALAEHAFFVRRRASPMDAALVAVAREAAGDPRAAGFLSSMRLSFKTQREALDKQLEKWRDIAKVAPARHSQRRPHRAVRADFSSREKQSLEVAA